MNSSTVLSHLIQGSDHFSIAAAGALSNVTSTVSSGITKVTAYTATQLKSREFLVGVGVATGFAVYLYVAKRRRRENNKHRTAERLAYGKFIPVTDFPDLSAHNNMLSHHLTLQMYTKLRDRVTPNGFTLDQAIQSGVDNPGHPDTKTVGIVAGDADSYHVFSPIFDPIIKQRNDGFSNTDTHVTELNPDKIVGGFLDERYVVSCRVRAGRSIAGHCLPPHCTRGERRNIEHIITTAVKQLPGELAGRYHPLYSINQVDQQLLIDSRILFDRPASSVFTCAGMARDWPDARGTFFNSSKNFIVWTNECDHLKIISQQRGGDLYKTFERFVRGIQAVENNLNTKGDHFMWDERLGYILTCPSNIGSGLKASVHVMLPLLSKQEKFEDMLKELRLEQRRTGDTFTNSTVFEISNIDRLGYTEIQLVQTVIDGVEILVEMELELEGGGKIQWK